MSFADIIIDPSHGAVPPDDPTRTMRLMAAAFALAGAVLFALILAIKARAERRKRE